MKNSSDQILIYENEVHPHSDAFFSDSDWPAKVKTEFNAEQFRLVQKMARSVQACDAYMMETFWGLEAFNGDGKLARLEYSCIQVGKGWFALTCLPKYCEDPGYVFTTGECSISILENHFNSGATMLIA